ncbi:MAG: tRNA pseudouridine(38-40) synthase TruA [Chloroflexi bacterium]|nr:tRNA pseudouridine(38-40) synthase TruA [Chloroflexota bacterium]
MSSSAPVPAPGRNVRLDLEYDGTDFAGFQVQRERRTVQGALEAVLATVTGESIRVIGAGRTDAGVHALAQVVNLWTAFPHPVKDLVRALNANLPPDLVVRRGEEVGPDFHARYSARGRSYRYTLWNAPERKALGRQYVTHWPGTLDDRRMAEAGGMLVGHHDFASFAGAAGDEDERSTTRVVYRCACWREGDKVQIEMAANAFLPHMVRNVVGTLLWVGAGRIAPARVAEMLAARERRLAGPTAPASGLCLVAVWY